MKKFSLSIALSLVLAIVLVMSVGVTGSVSAAETISVDHSHVWENLACSICGISIWDNGICRACGEEHSHVFDADSLCVACGYQCPHFAHDPYSLICGKCGYKVPHTFSEDGICKACNYMTAKYMQGSVDALYLKDVSERGRVEQLTYECIALAGKAKGTTITKKLNVYLPYGYSEAKQYNVVYYLHGAFGTINEAINPNSYSDMQKFFDNIIYKGVCEPFIYVTPTYFEPDSSDPSSGVQEEFSIELRNYIIPLVETTYSTFLRCIDISEVTECDITNSRDHRAITGFSGGATTTFAIMVTGLDMFSYFGTYSNTYDPLKLIAGIHSAEFVQYDIKYMINTTGSLEDPAALVANYNYIVSQEDSKMIDRENMILINHYGLNHDFENMRAALYNSLKYHFFLVVNENIDFENVKAYTGELVGKTTDTYGDVIYTVTLNDNLTIDVSMNMYNFMTATDSGSYTVNADGSITAVFTSFSSLGQTSEHNDVCVIQKVGKKWILPYVCTTSAGVQSATVSGQLSPIYRE